MQHRKKRCRIRSIPNMPSCGIFARAKGHRILQRTAFVKRRNSKETIQRIITDFGCIPWWKKMCNDRQRMMNDVPRPRPTRCERYHWPFFGKVSRCKRLRKTFKHTMPALRCPVLQRFDSFRVDKLSQTSSTSRSSTSSGSTISTPTSCNANANNHFHENQKTNRNQWQNMDWYMVFILSFLFTSSGTNRADGFHSKKSTDFLWLAFVKTHRMKRARKCREGSCACLLEKHLGKWKDKMPPSCWQARWPQPCLPPWGHWTKLASSHQSHVIKKCRWFPVRKRNFLERGQV